jgi:hypothetical protein
MIVAMFCGCTPEGYIAPPGEIALRYDSKSDTQYFFVLDNRSAQAVEIDGTKRFWTVLTPSHTFGCNGGYKVGDAPLEYVVDNYTFPRELFRILPDTRKRLAVERSEYSPRRRGETCQIELIRNAKVVVTSDSFSP